MADDRFEREYLGSAEALHRERTVSRASFALLSALSGTAALFAIASAGAALSGDPQGIGGAILMGLASGVLALAGVTTSVLRVVVTPSELRVHVGLDEQRVPLGAITSVTVLPYAEASRRRLLRPTEGRFIAVKGSDRVVAVTWTSAPGAPRTIFVGSDDPDGLASAIARARGAGSAGPRVRVGAEPAEGSAASIESAEEIGADAARRSHTES